MQARTASCALSVRVLHEDVSTLEEDTQNNSKQGGEWVK